MPETENGSRKSAGRGRNPLRDPRDRRLNRIAGPSSLVLFGVTGDLARKKLMPAVYDLANRGLLPPSFALVGFGRRQWDNEDFAAEVKSSVQAYARTPFDEAVWNQLSEGIRFVQGEFDDDDAFERLGDTIDELDAHRGTRGNHAFYLSIPPKAFEQVCRQLSKHGLAQAEGDKWRRVVIEKPFGHDLESARQLNDIVESVFPPDAVFRIDHYLGKETVQNILALRFANQLFEPLWNANYVDHVQITMAEDIGTGGRAGYYDGVGAARDVIQNHLLQLLALTAMEEPISFNADDLRAEKEKVLAAVKLPDDLSTHSARGQFAGGWQGGEEVQGYLEEEGIPADSTTETYAAIRVDIHTRRWAGVPFYLRAGKRLGRRVTEIAVVFKRAPNLLFRDHADDDFGQNAVVIRVQPDEGATIRFGSKVPGTQMEVRDVTMDFGYGHSFTESSPEAYERLILDVLLGEPPLFPRHAEVELSWKILDPFEDYWAQPGRTARTVRARKLGPRLRRRAPCPRRTNLEKAMIVDLPDTTTSKISKKIMSLREQGGVIALGRVLTLVVVTKSGLEEEAIEAANDASREHPCRIIVLADAGAKAPTRLDAQIRVGGDAGASEVIVLRGYGELAEESESLVAALLLPDAPIVAWWPHGAPKSACETSIGRIAHRRITDSANEEDPQRALDNIRNTYKAGDTDLAWTRLTNWRIQLAAVLDQVDSSPVTAVAVEGASDSPSTLLLAAWLTLSLDAPVTIVADPAGTGIRRVRLSRASGDVQLFRPGLSVAELTQPGQPAQRISLPRRSLRDCLAEELRRLDPDEVFGEVITIGLPRTNLRSVRPSER